MSNEEHEHDVEAPERLRESALDAVLTGLQVGGEVGGLVGGVYAAKSYYLQRAADPWPAEPPTFDVDQEYRPGFETFDWDWPD